MVIIWHIVPDVNDHMVIFPVFFSPTNDIQQEALIRKARTKTVKMVFALAHMKKN